MGARMGIATLLNPFINPPPPWFEEPIRFHSLVPIKKVAFGFERPTIRYVGERGEFFLLFLWVERCTHRRRLGSKFDKTSLFIPPFPFAPPLFPKSDAQYFSFSSSYPSFPPSLRRTSKNTCREKKRNNLLLLLLPPPSSPALFAFSPTRVYSLPLPKSPFLGRIPGEEEAEKR